MAVARAIGRWFLDHWVVVAGIVALVALVVAVHPAQVARALSRADPWMLALMLPTVLALYIVHGVAWWFALRGAGIQIGLRRAVAIMYISQTFTFLPGSDLWRVPLVQTWSETRAGTVAKPPIGAVTGTVVFDDLVFFCVLTAGMLPVTVHVPLLLIAVGATLLPQVLIFTILLWPRLYSALARLVTRLRPLRRFESQLQLLGPVFRRLFRPRTLIPVVVLDVLASLLAIALYALALRGVHADGVGIGRIAFTYSLGQVGSGLTVLPGALGIYEGLMTGLIAAQGVAPAVAALAALLYRAFNDILMGLIGFSMGVLLRRSVRQQYRPQPAHATNGPGSG
ncbi:MAG: lysylphosphatidylglycerol synthase transmembrane domain-containing protein [Candidatus Dormibacteraceae bacterium]